MNEISLFEKRFSSTTKERGYGKATLDQANTMCAEIGITSPKDLRKKKASKGEM